MIKKLLLLTLLFSIFSVPALADTGRHLVMLKGKAQNFESAVKDLGGSVAFRHNATGFAVVEGLDETGAAALSNHKGVLEIKLDTSFDLDPVLESSAAVSAEAMPASALDPTTAYFYEFYQWNMRAIDADLAWAEDRRGSSDITVAILDSGIDYSHMDLAGLVDLSRSASYVPSDDDLVATYFPGYHPIADLNYHGTHVAATVASNALLAAGVTSQTTLIGVKVCDWLGSCPFSSVIAGVLHAADNGADIANMSLGGFFSKAGNSGLVGFINKVFNYANSKGTLIVVSAGNDAIDLDHDGNSYKAYCSAPNTVCVSATGPTGYDAETNTWIDVDAFAGYSNYGRSAINVAAPGGNSGDSVWAACTRTSLILPFYGIDCSAGLSILGIGGTSMASPHAAGVAALIAEDVGSRPGRIRSKLQQTADDLGQPGTDPAYGKGRINAYNAVQ